MLRAETAESFEDSLPRPPRVCWKRPNRSKTRRAIEIHSVLMHPPHVSITQRALHFAAVAVLGSVLACGVAKIEHASPGTPQAPHVDDAGGGARMDTADASIVVADASVALAVDARAPRTRCGNLRW